MNSLREMKHIKFDGRHIGSTDKKQQKQMHNVRAEVRNPCFAVFHVHQCDFLHFFFKVNALKSTCSALKQKLLYKKNKKNKNSIIQNQNNYHAPYYRSKSDLKHHAQAFLLKETPFTLQFSPRLDSPCTGNGKYLSQFMTNLHTNSVGN